MNNNLSKIKRMSQIGYTITHGTPTESERICPHCDQPALVYSFAISTPPTYSLYIKCESCNVVQHFALDQKPPNFKPQLVKAEFQALEDEAIQRASQHPKESDQ